MDIQNSAGEIPGQGPQQGGAIGKVGDEVTVHDIQVEPTGPGISQPLQIGTDPQGVRRQKRGRDEGTRLPQGPGAYW